MTTNPEYKDAPFEQFGFNPKDGLYVRKEVPQYGLQTFSYAWVYKKKYFWLFGDNYKSFYSSMCTHVFWRLWKMK